MFQLWNVLHEIPDATVYLLEEELYPSSNRTLSSTVLNKTRVDCMLTLCLNLRQNGQFKSDGNEAPTQKVYKMKSAAIARYFDILVGSEKVSTQTAAMSIMNKRRLNCDVLVSHEHVEYFHKQNNAVKEQLSDCLLQTTMLYELLLKQSGEVVTHSRYQQYIRTNLGSKLTDIDFGKNGVANVGGGHGNVTKFDDCFDSISEEFDSDPDIFK